VARPLLAGTDGAALSKRLSIPHAGLINPKGFQPRHRQLLDLYRGDGKTTTGLVAYLRARRISRLVLPGLRPILCGLERASTAAKRIPKTYVVEDALPAGINTGGLAGQGLVGHDKGRPSNGFSRAISRFRLLFRFPLPPRA